MTRAPLRPADYATLTRPDEVTDYLVAQGRDPLEAVFWPPADDLLERFPDKFKQDAKAFERQAQERRDRQERDAQQLDADLQTYLSKMPKRLRLRLTVLIREYVARKSAP